MADPVVLIDNEIVCPAGLRLDAEGCLSDPAKLFHYVAVRVLDLCSDIISVRYYLPLYPLTGTELYRYRHNLPVQLTIYRLLRMRC